MRFIANCPGIVWLTGPVILIATVAWAGPASDVLLPNTTKGYVSIRNPEEAKEHFQQTQLGELGYDDAMRPFMDSVRDQLETKSGLTERLGIVWDNLDGLPAGELSLSIIERKGRDAVLAITIDVTGRAKQGERLIAAAEKRFAARGGKKQTATVGGATLNVFTTPAAKRGAAPIETVYFIHDDILCGVSGRDEAEAMLKRFAGEPADSLSSQPAYVATMKRLATEAGDLKPEVRWFVEPFGLIWAGRTINNSAPRRKDRDMAKILAEQGFDAIQGVGGFVNLRTPDHVDILYRATVYAPPVAGKEDDPLRWNKAMRMLQLPNSENWTPQSWAPRMSARYATFNIDPLAAFDHVDTLFDAIQGHKDAFKTSMEGIELDEYGPQVDVREQFVAYMGQRGSIVTDYVTPITVHSERSVIAIEAKEEAKLAASLAKIMEKEPDVERRTVDQLVVWERVPPEVGEEGDLDIAAPGFSPLSGDTVRSTKSGDNSEDEPVLPNSAVCVAFGHLMIASDIDYLREILAGFGKREMLAGSADYEQVAATMESLVPAARSAWLFSRTDEAYRPTYELIRQNRMPESETMFGRIINDLLTTEVEKEEGILRKQRIDGSKLPSFEMARRSFGPAGTAMRSEKDGWIITGAILNKEAP